MERKRNKQGQYLTEEERLILIKFYADGKTRSWLKEKSLADKTTMSAVIRHALYEMVQRTNKK